MLYRVIKIKCLFYRIWTLNPLHPYFDDYYYIFKSPLPSCLHLSLILGIFYFFGRLLTSIYVYSISFNLFRPSDSSSLSSYSLRQCCLFRALPIRFTQFRESFHNIPETNRVFTGWQCHDTLLFISFDTAMSIVNCATSGAFRDVLRIGAKGKQGYTFVPVQEWLARIHRDWRYKFTDV